MTKRSKRIEGVSRETLIWKELPTSNKEVATRRTTVVNDDWASTKIEEEQENNHVLKMWRLK